MLTELLQPVGFYFVQFALLLSIYFYNYVNCLHKLSDLSNSLLMISFITPPCIMWFYVLLSVLRR